MKPVTSGRVFMCPECGAAFILPRGCPDHPGVALVDPMDSSARDALGWRDHEARLARLRGSTAAGFVLGAGLAGAGWVLLSLAGAAAGLALGLVVMALAGFGGALVLRTFAARRSPRWFSRWAPPPPLAAKPAEPTATEVKKPKGPPATLSGPRPKAA